MKVLGNVSKGQVFVISAPAGTGKTTLVHMLDGEFPCVTESISCTTRPPRANEVEGDHYHFISEADFKAKLKAGEFLEHAEVFGHYYGTLRATVEASLNRGHHVVMVIDTQGAMKIKGNFPATFIFVSPPSFDELRERLFKRKTETPESIEHRLSWAKREMEMAQHYDYHIINDNLSVAYDVLRGILIAEEHKTRTL